MTEIVEFRLANSDRSHYTAEALGLDTPVSENQAADKSGVDR